MLEDGNEGHEVTPSPSGEEANIDYDNPAALTDHIMGLLEQGEKKEAPTKKNDKAEKDRSSTVDATDEEAEEADDEATGDEEASGDSDEAEAETEEEETDEESDDTNADSEEDAEPEEDDVLFHVKDGNGNQVPVTREEARRGYLRMQDYSRKTMETAKERDVVKEEKQQLEQAKQEYGNTLGFLRQMAQTFDPVLATVSNMTQQHWNQLAQEKPEEYNKLKNLLRDRQEQLSWIEQEQQKVQKEHIEKLVEQETAALYDRIPEWSDEKVAKKESDAIRHYMQATGFEDEEINSIYDSRQIAVLRDAMRWRNRQEASKSVAKKKTKKPTKVTKAQARNSEGNTSKTPKQSKKLQGAIASGDAHSIADAFIDNLM